MKYFKIVYKGNAVSLFNASDEKLISTTQEVYRKTGGEVIEISKEEYQNIENRLLNAKC